MNRVFRNTIFYLLILLVVIGVVSLLPDLKSENRKYVVQYVHQKPG